MDNIAEIFDADDVMEVAAHNECRMTRDDAKALLNRNYIAISEAMHYAAVEQVKDILALCREVAADEGAAS